MEITGKRGPEGVVKAVCTSEKKGVEKHSVPEGHFLKDFGIEGDAHAGKAVHGQRLCPSRHAPAGAEGLLRCHVLRRQPHPRENRPGPSGLGGRLSAASAVRTQ